jgi:hypothetical protein
MDSHLSEEIARLKGELENNPAKLAEIQNTVQHLAEAHPTDAWLRAEIGGIFDSNGFEAEACVWSVAHSEM